MGVDCWEPKDPRADIPGAPSSLEGLPDGQDPNTHHGPLPGLQENQPHSPHNICSLPTGGRSLHAPIASHFRAGQYFSRSWRELRLQQGCAAWELGALGPILLPIRATSYSLWGGGGNQGGLQNVRLPALRDCLLIPTPRRKRET